MIRTVYSFVVFMLFGSLSAVENLEYHIHFTKIDNQVKVYVDTKLIYESEVIDGNPDLDIKVRLDKHLVKGMNKVKIELYNGSDMNQVMTDTNWEIRYEIFRGEESIDYMHQTSENGRNGLSADFQHDIIVP